MAAGAIPQLTRGLDAARTRAAARFLAQQCGLARFRAVAAGRTVALRFTPRGGDYAFQMFGDGNGNGVRSAEIDRGIDLPVGAVGSLGADFPGVRIAVLPEIGGDPVRLGGTTLLSFTPSGTASSGSVFVLGRGGAQYAVRILGATGRTRLQRYAAETATWVDP